MGLLQILFSGRAIEFRLEELARRIQADFPHYHKHARPVFVAIQNGGGLVARDLLRKMGSPGDTTLCFLNASSYKGTESTGEVKIDFKIPKSLRDNPLRPIILIDDILDTGLTMKRVIEHLNTRGFHNIHIFVLLNKRARRVFLDIAPEYVGFEVDDIFVVGYNLDYEGDYRLLENIHEFVPDPEKPVTDDASSMDNFVDTA